MNVETANFKLRNHCHVKTNEEGDRFVGIKADSNGVRVNFPIGYDLPKDEDELRRDIRNLFQVLSLFSTKEDRLIHSNKFKKSKEVEFPIQAYLNVINYYLDHNGNYYIERETEHKISNRGKTDWARTIKTQRPLIYNNSFVYMDEVVRVSKPDLNRLITKINKYCVYESFQRLGWLYSSNRPEKSDISFSKNLFLSVLNAKLSNTNNDVDKQLFKSMIAMINYQDQETSNREFYFGTDKFEHVWERLIDVWFGEKNKKAYFPHGVWTERYGPNKNRKSSALEPDSIMIYDDKYYVIDSKYYRYGTLSEFQTESLPCSSDINKQITYGEYVHDKLERRKEVFNAFVMPFNKNNNIFNVDKWCLNVVEGTGEWLSNPESYQKVQGIVIDTRYLMKNYYENHEKDKGILGLEIEN